MERGCSTPLYEVINVLRFCAIDPHLLCRRCAGGALLQLQQCGDSVQRCIRSVASKAANSGPVYMFMNACSYPACYYCSLTKVCHHQHNNDNNSNDNNNVKWSQLQMSKTSSVRTVKNIFLIYYHVKQQKDLVVFIFLLVQVPSTPVRRHPLSF